MLRAPHTRKARLQLTLVAIFLFAFTLGVKAVSDYLDRQALYADLRDAISAGNVARVKLFERDGIDWRDLTDYANNYSALHHAVRYNRLELVRYFVENGADVFAKTADGWTPADIAAQWRYLEILKYLLMDSPYGERILREDKSIHPIGPFTDLELLLWMAQRMDLRDSVWGDDAYRLLYQAVAEENLAAVELLLRIGAPSGMAAEEWDEGFRRGEVESAQWLKLYNTPDALKPLHRAAQLGNATIVEMLIAHGADPTLKDTHDKTPLEYARESDRHEVVELIEANLIDD